MKMMQDIQEVQKEFMELCEQYLPGRFTDYPVQLKPNKETKMWAKLITEEFQEFQTAYNFWVLFSDLMNKDSTFSDRVELEHHFSHMVKELADLLYVILGFANNKNIPLFQAFHAVHENNLSKATPIRDTKGSILGYRLEKRADGKILKPQNYLPVDMHKEIFLSLDTNPKAE